MIQVIHVTPSLTVGGAELMLLRLISRMDRGQFQSEVVSLTETGPVGDRLRQIGVPVSGLGMQRSVPNPIGLIRLWQFLKVRRPTIVQTWMYQGDLLGGVASRLCGYRCIWNIRNSTLDAERTKSLTLWTRRTCARLSGVIPRRIVCCSQVARNHHEQLGYKSKNIVVIPNGFDLEQFQPKPELRAAIRRQLGLANDSLIVGLVARFHPQKDHRTFATAAAIVAARLPNAYFVLCGDGVDHHNPLLRRCLETSGIANRCFLLGRRDDVSDLTASFDVAVSSSSYGEAFSNALGEAMAAAVPCVATDVGDSRLILGDTGIVVAPKDPVALAEGVYSLLTNPPHRAQLGAAARERIATRFGLDQTITAYQSLYNEVAAA